MWVDKRIWVCGERSSEIVFPSVFLWQTIENYNTRTTPRPCLIFWSSIFIRNEIIIFAIKTSSEKLLVYFLSRSPQKFSNPVRCYFINGDFAKNQSLSRWFVVKKWFQEPLTKLKSGLDLCDEFFQEAVTLILEVTSLRLHWCFTSTLFPHYLKQPFIFAACCELALTLQNCVQNGK